VSRGGPSGILPVEKGPGVTSFQVVALLRRTLRAPRVGHGGTLDPEATGVLPILIGEATKLTPYLIELDKEYVATVRLGVVTDTQDAAGTVLETRPVPPLDRATVEAALGRFVGVISQVPPMHSAIRRGGQRLYELARAGRTVEREPRPVVVYEIALLDLRPPTLTLRVRCGKGTYVRTLAADLGQALGCGASLGALTRTRVGPYALEEAVPWTVVRESVDASALWARVLPPASALAGHPSITLDADGERAFGHGQAVRADVPDGLVQVHGRAGDLLGVGRARDGAVKPERLLHADPPRPRILPA
jgi:tRNA pseudouridine55 synthase